MARPKQKSRLDQPLPKRTVRKASVKAAKRDAGNAKPKPIEQAVEKAKPTPVEAILLPETLDSASATEIRNLILPRRGGELIVDARQVRRTGMQAVQVLIAAARTWQADGQSYVVSNPSNEFLDTLALVGLSRDLLHVEGISQ